MRNLLCAFVILCLLVLKTNAQTCHADFTFAINNLQVTFTNTSNLIPHTNEVTSWHFGDMGTSSSYSPVHTYTSGGSYSVKLVTTWHDSASFSFVCIDSVTKTVILTATNINNFKEQSPVSIYPNPAKGMLNIHLNAAAVNASVLITDITGKTVLYQNISGSDAVLKLEHLMSGLYFITVRSDKESYTQKLLLE